MNKKETEYGRPMTEKAAFIIRCRALVVVGDKLLVVKHFEGAKYYALPGGHMENNEDPEICIKREIKEELNVDIQKPILKYIYSWKEDGKLENIEFVFLVKDEVTEADVDMERSSHAFEIFESKWIGKDEIIDGFVYPKESFKDFQENNLEFEGVKFIKD